MTHNQMLTELAHKTQYTTRELRSIIQAFVEIVREEIESGRDIQVTNLGVFKNVRQGPRCGRHPVTGGRIPIPPTRRVLLRPCVGFRAAVRASAPLFEEEELAVKFGLKERDDGKVRSADRSQQGAERKEGRGGR